MLRRFLDGLEKGVERTLGEHMDLVDYVNLIGCSGRSKINFLKDRSDIINAVV